MGLLGSKGKPPEENVDSPAVPEPAEMSRGHSVEVLGKKFRVVREGLDPAEVMAYLESVAGSSEAAFKRLDQFSAFQEFSKALNDSITEARQLAERAKAQAEMEAQQEKARIIEEAGGEVAAMLEQVRLSCVASLNHTLSTLQEAMSKALEAERQSFEKAQETIEKAREVERRAFEKAQETSLKVREFERTAFEKARAMIEGSLTDIERNLPEVVRSHLGQPEIGAGSASQQEEALPAADAVAEPVDSMAADTVLSDDPEDVAAAADAGDPEAASEAPTGETEEVSAITEGAERLFSGSVTVAVSGGVDEPWVRQLRQRVEEMPGARIREESGGDTATFTMSLVLDTPTALMPILAALPDVASVVETRSAAATQRRPVLRFRPGGLWASEQTILTVELARRAITPDNEPVEAL